MRIYIDDNFIHFFNDIIRYHCAGFNFFIFDYNAVWACDIWYAYF